MRSALFWDITQRIVVIPYRHFGTTYRSREGRAMRIQKEQERKSRRLDRHIRDGSQKRRKGRRQKCPETSVRNYHNALGNNRERNKSRDAGHPKIHHRKSTHFRLTAWRGQADCGVPGSAACSRRPHGSAGAQLSWSLRSIRPRTRS